MRAGFVVMRGGKDGGRERNRGDGKVASTPTKGVTAVPAPSGKR